MKEKTILHQVLLTAAITGIKLMNIPVYIEGESAWSYLSRLAYVNVFDNTDKFLNTLFNTNQKEWKYDCVSPYLFNFLKADGIENWNYSSSVYQYLLPFVPEEKHDARIRGYYSWPKTHTKIIDSFKPQISTLKVCPECMKRDVENHLFHYHIEHQIPGLTLCPEHKCGLEYYTGKHGDEYSSRTFTAIEPTGNAEVYAEFCHGLIENPITTSFKETNMVLKTKIAKKFKGENFIWNAENTLIREFFESFGFASDIFNLIIRNTTRSEIPVEDIITLLIYFYGSDSEAFRKDCLKVATDNVSNEEFLSKLNSSGYTVLGTYNPFYLTLEFNRPYMRKSETFTTTKHSLLTGWTTPNQDMKSSPAELFRQLFKAAANTSHLTLISEFNNWSTSITVKDDTQNKFTVVARDFIYSGVRTGSLAISEEHIMNYFAKKPDFTLLSIDGKVNPFVRIQHSCGREMYISYNSFLAAPYCETCKNDTRRAKLADDIQDITKGRFHLERLSRSFYSASNGETTITDSSIPGLKQKLSSLTYKAEREIHRVTYREKLEQLINNLLKKEEQKIYNAENYLAYGSLKDVLFCMQKFEKTGQLIQLSRTIFCEKGSVYSASDYCKVMYRKRRNKMIAIPFGESLLEEIGANTSGNQEYATNLVALARSGKSTKKIGNNTVTLVRLKTEFTDDNWKALSLLLTVNDEDKLKNMSEETKRKLSLWCNSNEITIEKIKEQKKLFSEATINRAATLLGA